MKKIKTQLELDKLASSLGLKRTCYTDIASKFTQADVLAKFDLYQIKIQNYFIIIKCQKNTKRMISFYKNDDFYHRFAKDLVPSLKTNGIIFDFYN